MKTKLTRVIALALSLMLLAGTSAAAANGPHTDSDMGGVGGMAGSGEIDTFDPMDNRPARSVGEWLDKWNGGFDIDFRLIRDVGGLIPGIPTGDGPSDGPAGDPTPKDDDETDPCEANPDSPQCTRAVCDQLDGVLNEYWENGESDEIEWLRDWYESNCLN